MVLTCLGKRKKSYVDQEGDLGREKSTWKGPVVGDAGGQRKPSGEASD